MGVVDASRELPLPSLSVEEKYRSVAEALFLDGKPELRGSLPVRAFDSVVLRSLGVLLATGRRQPTVEQEYQRITGNFDRVGVVGGLLGRCGAPGRVVVRSLMSVLAHLIVRQALFGVRAGSNAREAATGYFTVADRLDFQMEIHSVDDEQVEFSFLRCPAGYTRGERMRICMATNKWDRECVRALGARMVMDELIPEGAETCRGHIVCSDRRVSDGQRRYARGTV